MEPLGTSTVLLVICISCLLLSAFWKSQANKRKMPPGPTPLPIIGNALQLKTNHLDLTLCKLSKSYGPIFTLYFGPRPVVVLHGYGAVKEALIERADEFAARGRMPSMEKYFQGKGIIFSNGETWKQLRRFALTTLRNFGMGKKSIEERIQEEAQYLLEQLQGTKEEPFDPTFLLNCATSNIICSVVFAKHYDYDDKKFLAIMALMHENFEILNSPWGQLANLFPSFMDLIPGPHHRVGTNFKKAKVFVMEEMEAHRETLDPSSPRDFIDCFYIKMDQEKNTEASEFTIENLLMSAINLFGAGTETTSTTLRYGLLILQKYPEIEEKVQEEIDRVVGRSRAPCMSDRGQMPYTDAVIHEIQRFISLIPLSLPHSVNKDTVFRGYTIPKDTTVFPLLTSVLHDDKEFPNPREFDPQHFLNKDGTFRKSDYFMPFSAGKKALQVLGKRICAGEGLARMELFLFLASILQNFKLKPLTDPQDIDIKPHLSSIGNVPPPYRLCVVPR
nr:PREDICTED: cytochrome P450 2C18 isoform X1 [Anolis carolinensis]|eukprot:XP_008115228.1 PREDICTED: cytochrome P450 2C18 isoform X1 [Anolis carolinensis]